MSGHECQCSSRGNCPVLGVSVTEQLRQLCSRNHEQAKRIAKAIKAGRDLPTKEVRHERLKAKIEAATRRKQRLIGWLRFFRLPTDRGVGDTAARLRQQQPKSPVWVVKDATQAVKSLLSQCSCSRKEAVKKLNEQYPY